MATAPAESTSAEPTRTYTHPKTGKPTQMKTGNIGKSKKTLEHVAVGLHELKIAHRRGHANRKQLPF